MDRFLVLVVADTLEDAALTKWLVAEAMPGIGVLTTLSSEVARTAAAVQPDVVVTVTDSLEHFGDIHDAHAGVPIALLGSSQTAVANGANAVFADVPTLAESALPGFNAMSWIGLLAPAGTPPDLVEKIAAAVGHVQDESAGLVLEHLGREVGCAAGA